jgi:COP9 signalosome complex subunit 12
MTGTSWLSRSCTDADLSRAELHESRKWGIYYVINLLFKTYFKLNSASLSRTILKTLAVYKEKGDMPPLESFPKSHRVTFKYYEGVLFFLEENYLEVGGWVASASLCGPADTG